MDHNKHDKNCHLLKHSCEKNHQHAQEHDFKVLGNNYRSDFNGKLVKLFYKAIKTVTERERKINSAAVIQLIYYPDDKYQLEADKIHSRTTHFVLFLILSCQV